MPERATTSFGTLALPKSPLSLSFSGAFSRSLTSISSLPELQPHLGRQGTCGEGVGRVEDDEGDDNDGAS